MRALLQRLEDERAAKTAPVVRVPLFFDEDLATCERCAELLHLDDFNRHEPLICPYCAAGCDAAKHYPPSKWDNT
jgi:hypothetical protein